MKNPFKPKASNSDYTEAMLPHNRKEVFFDVVKLNWFRLLGLGALVLIFSLPMHIFTLIEDSHNATLLQELESMTAEQQAEAYSEMLSMSSTKAILNIFSFVLISVCIAGLVRIIRQYAWGENVVHFSDFMKGIKQNGKQMAILGFLIGFFNAFAVYAYSISAVSEDALNSVLFMIPVGFSIFLGIPVAAYTVVCIPIYSNSFFQNLMTALATLAKSPIKSFAALVCCLVPFIPQMIPDVYFHLFGGIIGALLSPFVMLGWFLFASNRLDEHINKERFPSIVGKGTFPLEDAQEES